MILLHLQVSDLFYSKGEFAVHRRSDGQASVALIWTSLEMTLMEISRNMRE